MSYETATALRADLAALLDMAKPAEPSAPANLVDRAIALVKPSIEALEGDRLTGYLDPAGHPTIGYGHTPAVVGQKITQAQADMLLAHDLLTFAQGILPLLTVIPGVGQYAALISFAFNVGVPAFKASHLLVHHNEGDVNATAAEFLLWDKAHVNGQLVELPGLLARRKQEAAMYLKG